jgi:hypothetical protein
MQQRQQHKRRQLHWDMFVFGTTRMSMLIAQRAQSGTWCNAIAGGKMRTPVAAAQNADVYPAFSKSNVRCVDSSCIVCWCQLSTPFMQAHGKRGISFGLELGAG